ncbi:hypothetical protein N658DRAFT_158298 [Parathielavia hyrcaniae]|uniref:Uncharacterized protein n=1 Tax=Parathielavia hyrcaniae TaxID=113614 RepID=A0AAN6Q2B9_9PEZI|nr:hypothetical protein N658DRAFT_158298 [Parathielavia hyrcaniae]
MPVQAISPPRVARRNADLPGRTVGFTVVDIWSIYVRPPADDNELIAARLWALLAVGDERPRGSMSRFRSSRLKSPSGLNRLRWLVDRPLWFIIDNTVGFLSKSGSYGAAEVVTRFTASSSSYRGPTSAGKFLPAAKKAPLPVSPSPRTRLPGIGGIKQTACQFQASDLPRNVAMFVSRMSPIRGAQRGHVVVGVTDAETPA